MLKIKIIIITLLVLLLTGCSLTSGEYEQDKYVDKDTCVVYLTRYHGGISPMYNQDGTLKLDKKCLDKIED